MITLQERVPNLELTGISTVSYYKDGSIKDCMLNEENTVDTGYGALVPKYGPEDARRKFNHSMSFYPSGAVRSMALERQSGIPTPLGVFPAELVTFYESGALKRLFPLNGKISGYWTETDEGTMCQEFQFRFSFGSFKAKIISLCFYESGQLKALTLWPGETVYLRTSLGLMPVKTGFSLYEDGSLQSVEPAYELTITTPIGYIDVFDEAAIGICAESNSLCFDQSGNISSLVTSSTRITVMDNTGKTTIQEPALRPDPFEEDKYLIVPLKISFEGSKVKFECKESYEYDLKTTRFNVLSDGISRAAAGFSCGDCSTCNLCK